MKQIFIPEKVVFHIESDGQVGTIHDLKSGKRAYVNTDTIEVIQYLLNGCALDSFFPAEEIPRKERIGLIRQSESVLRNLVLSGLLAEERLSKQGLIKKVTSNPPLRVVFVELTKKCNLRCEHCYVPDCSVSEAKANTNSTTFDDIRDLISQIDELGVMELQLTGGEPFILPRILDIIKEAQSRLIPCSVFTNGTLMTEKIFRYISENNYGLIFYISLDGYQETHDAFRKHRGAFQKTVATIKRLLQIGCDVRINTSIGRHNIVEMRQFIEFVKNEFGVLHRLVTVEPIGRANAEMTISAEEFADLLQESGNTFEFLDSHDSIADWIIPACGIGSSMLFVDAYGNISLCPTLTQRENPGFLAGNIARSSLKDIWENSLVFKKIRGFQCREVEQCHFRELCKGGCRSRAYLATGDVNSPDLAMCLLYNAR
ncbi:MAG: radical SAM protein [Patescibacteria group bacterium]|nr:radical SAM protein [Patescibacteria group bacterium]